MNLGIQDAVNLGWKLAYVVKGTAPPSVLDSYHTERHPVAASMLRYTLASVALQRTDDRSKALSAIVQELVSEGQPSVVTAGRMSGLDIRYDLGAGHLLLGRRLPDLDVVTSDGPTRLFSLLHDARPLLLSFDGRSLPSFGRWHDVVVAARVTYDGPWEVPVIGQVPAPTAVLVRPDGYVAWVGEDSIDGLVEALETWFGPR